MAEIIDINTLFGPLPSAASDLSVDDLLALMRSHGVQRSCTLSTVGLLLDHNAGNAATRAACAESADLIPVATMNPQSFFGGDGPHTRFKGDGFRMVRLAPQPQGWHPGYAPFLAVAAALEAEQLPLMVDVPMSGWATALMAGLAGHAGPVILGGVDDSTLSEAVALMRGRQNLFVESSRLLATGALKCVVDAVGADRVMFGSGSPAQPVAAGLAVIGSSGLTEDQRSAILAGTARRVLEL